SVLCTIAFGLGSGVGALGLAWAANRYVQSMGWGSVLALTSRWYSVRLHGTVVSILCLRFLLGDGFVPLFLGEPIPPGLGWRGVFIIAAGTLSAIALVSYFTLKASPRDVGGEEAAANPESVFADQGAAGRPESLGHLLWPLFTSPTFWLICTINAGLCVIR